MKIQPNTYFIIFLIFLTNCSEKETTSLYVVNLKCEYMNEALIAITSPRFSWELSSMTNNQYQKAWQIIVGTDLQEINLGRSDIWDSGKIKGSKSSGIKLPDSKLKSFEKYYWSVRIWNEKNEVTNWASPGSFITGALNQSDWKAKWIGDNKEIPLDYPLLYKHIGYLSSYTGNPDEEKWIEIDLGASREFDTIRLYPSYNDVRSIPDYYFPLSFRIETSSDRSIWNSLYKQQKNVSPDNKPVTIPVVKSRSRFIRLTATKLRKYDHRIFDYDDQGDTSKMYALSLAEMQILNGNEVISTKCRVLYKDALVKVDREDGYDPEMITDGITGTPVKPSHRAIPPSPLIRKLFILKAKPEKALAFISGLGIYEVSFNTSHPDQRVLAPEWTDYNKRIQYQGYDVTGLINEGPNTITAQLADGWYAGMLGPTRWSEYFPKRGAYGLDRRLFLQLEITYQDGTKETVSSDENWKIFPDGPVRIADNFLGETYDARKEIIGWQSNDFDDSGWTYVVAEKNDRNLVPQINQPVRIIETLACKNITKTKKGYWLFDVGENIAGWCMINPAGKPGDKIILRHGEILDNKGELYTDNLGAAIQTDTIILGPSGMLQYEPRFTYHGFRYVEVQGLRSEPDKSFLSARVIASDQPRTGYFECSNQMLNQLYKNLNRSHVSNMHGIPTDCPQRDERCGWMGDVYIFAQTSMFNRDMAAFYSKWMTDIIDAQSERGTFPDIAPHPFGYEKHFTNAPGWADAGIRLPWLMFLNYNDKDIITDNFKAFEKYIENIVRNNPDLIWRKGLGLNYGDWLNGNTLNAEGFPKTGAQIPSEVFSTIMFYNSVITLSKMAGAVSMSERSEYYNELAVKIKSAFNKEFVDKEGKITGDAQACYAMALYYNISSEEMEKIFEKRMIDKFIPYSGRMNTGFHSTLCLMQELVKLGYTDKAYQLLETTEFPSWGYSIEQGATSIWERWDGYVKGRGFQGAGMNSFNHYAFGSIGEWMYENILGIQPSYDNPGFTHFILKPVPGGTLTWAKGRYNSFSGTIEAAWKREGGSFEYDFTIPPNTTATVYIPAKNPDNITFTSNGTLIKPDHANNEKIDGYEAFIINSGIYSAVSEL